MAWVQGSGGCEKGSFQKNPGLPLKHSHVKWQLPQPIPSLHGKREREVQATKGGTHTHPVVPTHKRIFTPNPFAVSACPFSVHQFPQLHSGNKDV